MHHTSLKSIITHQAIQYTKGFAWSAGEIAEESDGSSDVEGAEEMDGQVNGFLDTDCMILQYFHSKKIDLEVLDVQTQKMMYIRNMQKR